MANPRNIVDFVGIGERRATYIADGSTIVYDGTKTGGTAAATLNKAVTLSADGIVALTADGDAVEGKLILVEADGKCTVIVGGYVELPGGLSATLTRGTTIVGATGTAGAKGFIRSAASGTAAELIKARGRIVSSGTATAVVVDLS